MSQFCEGKLCTPLQDSLVYRQGFYSDVLFSNQQKRLFQRSLRKQTTLILVVFNCQQTQTLC